MAYCGTTYIPGNTMTFNVERWLSDTDTLKHLVSKGFRIMHDVSGQERYTLLCKVFRDNNIECLAEIIDNGLDLHVDAKDAMRWSFTEIPLILALESITNENPNNIVEYLINKGCAVNMTVHSEQQVDRYYAHLIPLVVAVKQNLPKAVESLLKHGAVVSKSVLEAVGHSWNPCLVKVLVDFNIDLNGDNGIILHNAITGLFRHICLSKHHWITFIENLLEGGADPNVKNKNGYTAGHALLDTNIVSEDDKCAVLGLLLKFGLDLEQCTDEGLTLLMLAAMKDCEQTTKCLVEAGANVNATDIYGNTPMMHLVSVYCELNCGLLEYLIANNADVNTMNCKGKSIIDSLLTYRCEDLLIFLLSSTEVRLPEYKGYYPKHSWCLINGLIQAGWSSPILLEHVLGNLIEENNNSGHQLIVHSDPTFFGKKLDEQDPNHETLKLKDPFYFWEDDVYEPLWDSDSLRRNYMADNRSVTSLKTWSVYHLRRHLLEVTGNKSIILRLKQLPLPQTLLSLVTLECFTFKPTEPKYFNDDTSDYYDYDHYDNYNDGCNKCDSDFF